MTVIVVSGPPGSGKTTQAKLIAEYYGLKYYSAGMIFRKIAKDRGVSLEELSRIAAKDPSIDLEIDSRSLDIAKKGNVVIDGHLTAWIVSEYADLKILITAPLLIRIKRIAQRDKIPFSKAIRETINREYYQVMRFIEYYGIDPRETNIFDIIVNTEQYTIEETFNIIKKAIDKILKAKNIR